MRTRQTIVAVAGEHVAARTNNPAWGIRPASWWLVLIPAVLLLSGVVLFWTVTIDDAYITARYAKNIAGGLGAVFNPGERVEGFSDPLWLFVMTIAALAGTATIIPAVKVLGLVASLGLLIISFSVLRRHVSGVAAVAPAILASTLPALPFWSVAGLETTAYVFLGLAAIVVAAKTTRTDSRTDLVAGALAAAAALTRPEGALLILPVMLTATLSRPREVSRRRPFVPWITFSVIFGAYLAFRLSYYHEWLPNTYLAKPGGLSQIRSGLNYMSHLLRSSAALALLGAVCVGAMNCTRKTASNPVMLGCMLAALQQIAFTVWAGGDWMPVERFAVPIWGFLLIPSGLGVEAILRWMTNRGSKAAALVVVATVFTIICVQTHKFYGVHRDNHWRLSHGLDSRIAFGEWLRLHAPSLTIAYGDMGALPFSSNHRYYDFHGLVDQEIAKIVHRRESDVCARIQSTILKREPDAIIVVTYEQSPDAPSAEFGFTLRQDPHFRNIYGHAATLITYPPGLVPAFPKGRFLQVYLRRGSEIQGLREQAEVINRRLLDRDRA